MLVTRPLNFESRFDDPDVDSESMFEKPVDKDKSKTTHKENLQILMVDKNPNLKNFSKILQCCTQ